MGLGEVQTEADPNRRGGHDDVHREERTQQPVRRPEQLANETRRVSECRACPSAKTRSRTLVVTSSLRI